MGTMSDSDKTEAAETTEFKTIRTEMAETEISVDAITIEMHQIHNN